MIISHNIKVSPKTIKPDKGEEKVKMRIVVTFKNNEGRVRKDYYPGFIIDKTRWDPKEQKMKGTDPDSSGVEPMRVNSEIRSMFASFERVFRDFEYKEVIPTTAQFHHAFQRLHYSAAPKKKQHEKKANTKQPDSMLLIQAIEQFIVETGRMNAWARRTYLKYNTLKNEIRDFDAGLKLTEFTVDKFIEYVYFLQNGKRFQIRRRSEDDLEEYGLKNTTIRKKVTAMKEVLNWAYDKGYYHDDSFRKFKPRLRIPQKTIIFLNEEEVNRLRKYEIPPDKRRLEKIRDLFLFSCFTGFRYSDVKNLKRANIKENGIEINSVKTDDHTFVEFNKTSRAIIEKYKTTVFPGDKALPQISNQKMNDSLKELFRMAGFDKTEQQTYYRGEKRYETVDEKWRFITTHVGRHTFITNGLARGVPVPTMMQWTGHNSYDAMKPYIAIVDNLKAEQMDKYNW